MNDLYIALEKFFSLPNWENRISPWKDINKAVHNLHEEYLKTTAVLPILTVMTLKQLKMACKRPRHGLAGYYNGGELYVNNKDGKTLYQRQMERKAAEEICEDLDIELTEV